MTEPANHAAPAGRAPLDAARLRAALLRPVGAWERVEVVGTSPSTNAALVALARDPGWRAPAALVAEHQTAGRGRAGRGWETPPGAALTVSALLRPGVPPEALGWLPLLGGLAVVRALRTDGVPAAVKWPNDVLLPAAEPVAGLGPWRKVAGLLAEVVPAGPGAGPAAVVLGVGLNVAQTPVELPVPTATSLALAGAAGERAARDRTRLLVAVLRELAAVVGRWVDDGGDPHATGADGGPSLAAQYAAASATLGTPVRVELAGTSAVLEGTALRLADDGSLVVGVADAAGRLTEHVVAAGDVHHLRRG